METGFTMHSLLAIACITVTLCQADEHIMSMVWNKDSASNLDHHVLKIDVSEQQDRVKRSSFESHFATYLWDGSNFPANLSAPACNPQPAGNQDNKVCNPERKLTDTEVNDLNNRIYEIQDAAGCQCGKTPGCNGRKGRYNIGIAVVETLATKYAKHCAVDKIRVLATELRAVKWNSTLNQCNDHMVIGLATGISGTPNTGGVFTSTSPKVRSRISDECVTKIFNAVGGECAAGRYFKCLDEMLIYYKNALTGGACGKRSGGTALTGGEIAGIVIGTLAGIAVIVLLIFYCDCGDEIVLLTLCCGDDE